jgi:predicted RNase H-like HicB family nuclease
MAQVDRFYVAIIEGGDTPGFSVFFPDIPGCTSGGDTADEAATNAREALNLHLSCMVEDGEALPRSTPIQEIVVDPEIQEVARVLVPADVTGKTVRLNISLDEAVVALADRKAAAQGYTRSGFIASLIRADAARLAKRAAPAKPKPKRRRSA